MKSLCRMVVVMASCLFVLLCNSTSSSAATKAGPALANAPVMYVVYEIFVKGRHSFTKDDTTTSWRVAREYSGVAKLDKRSSATIPATPVIKPGMTRQQIQAEFMRASRNLRKVTQWNSAFVKTNSWRKVRIVVNDQLERVISNEGLVELNNDEASVTTTRQTWKCDAEFQTINYGVVTYNTKAATFDTSVGFGPRDERKLRHVTEFKRNPPKESLPDKTTEELLGINSLNVPTLTNWLQSAGIRRLTPRRVNASNDTAQFDSGAVPIQTDFPGFPESKGKVTVQVRFKLASFL